VLYALLLIVSGAIGWTEAVSAIRQTLQPSLRD